MKKELLKTEIRQSEDMLQKSDLSSYGLEYFKEIETKLRNKFMECLNYRTPQEAWDKEISKYRNKKIPFRGIMSDINNQLSRSEVECVKCSD